MISTSCPRWWNRANFSPMSQLTDLTISEARKALREKKFSALELADAYLAEMEAYAARG